MTWRRGLEQPCLLIGAAERMIRCFLRVRHSYAAMCFLVRASFWADEPGVSIADIAPVGKILMDPTTAAAIAAGKAGMEYDAEEFLAQRCGLWKRFPIC